LMGNARHFHPSYDVSVVSQKIDKATPGNYLRVALAQLELNQPDLGWYEATRHTFASQWVLAGNSIEKLCAILGHYSVVMTERYAHLRPELFTQADLATIAIDLRPGSAKVGELGHRMATDPTNPTTNHAEKEENGQSRPVSRVLSRRVVAFPAVADIPLGPTLPPASSGLPGSAAGNRIAPLCALAPGGACRAARVATGAVRSYRTVSPLPAFAGGLFSVALSRESPRLAVSQHPALWSPDFPPARFEDAGVRPGGSDQVEF